MNNKGIVLSTVVYTVVVFFIFLLLTMIFFTSNSISLFSRLADNAKDNISTDSPTISFTGDLEFMVGSEFVDDVVVTDTVDGDITDKVRILETFDMNRVGTYNITYVVTNSRGKTSSKTRKVIIFDKEPSPPNLADNMIPIYYDEATSEWKKADENNTDGTYKWYDYNAFMWANAVTVTSTTRDAYKSANVGTVVNMDDILTMMVWIPRYRYKLWNVVDSATSTEQMINIEFENKTTTKSTGTTNGTWYTHPAFTFGTEELDGIWVGKFETTGTITDITVKPNITSIRSQTVKAMFEASLTLDDSTTKYGYINNTVADTHMMKNTEWGAVAYLYHSKYGKYGNSSYTGENKEIWINNSASMITGCAGNSVSASGVSGCQNMYNTTNGLQASTTGTVYGVYDMSGGASEYVMGVMKENGSENITVGGSGFTNTYFNSTNMTKYVDKYAYDTDYGTFNRYIKGDATKETVKTWAVGYNSWYEDNSSFVNSSSPWFGRDGFSSDIMHAGAFYFGCRTGTASSIFAFRLVTK